MAEPAKVHTMVSTNSSAASTRPPRYRPAPLCQFLCRSGSAPRLLDLGLACMIGKGKRDEAVKAAVVRNGAVYLAAIGGAGALMAGSVKSCEIIAWPDLGCEAVRRLEVVDMPLTVLLDAHGGDLYQSGPQAYLQSLT